MNHDLSEHANIGGYWYACSCGAQCPPQATIAARRKEKARHLRDVENHQLWWALKNDEQRGPFTSKSKAYTALHVTSGKKVEGGYSAGGWLVTNTPEGRGN